MSFDTHDRRPGFSLDSEMLVVGGVAGVAAVVTAARQGRRVNLVERYGYGHAIGHAAAMCLEARCEPRELRGERQAGGLSGRPGRGVRRNSW